jgi:DNA-binding transcriptional LysR family regulator
MAVDGISTYWLPQFLAPFLRRHPMVDIALFTSQDRYAQKKPIYDLSLQYMETTSQHMVSIRLAKIHFMLFAMRDYIQERGMPADIADLAHHRIVDLSLDMGERGMLTSLTRFGGRTALLTNSVGAMCETIRYGGGIGLLPTYAALLEPDVVPVLADLNHEAQLFLSFERESGQHPAVRTTIDFLKTLVFDQKAMPWFSGDHERPAASWNRIYRKTLLAAHT